MDNAGARVRFRLEPEDNARLASLCGRLDEHLHQIERRLRVQIAVRGNVVLVSGAEGAARQAHETLDLLYRETARGKAVTSEAVGTTISQVLTQTASEETEEIRLPKTVVALTNARQRAYVGAIRTHDITFGIGPAGTGKTFLAVACAVAALERDQVHRIVLVRPAVEAGERLGFLPGDVGQKVDPYLRPLYDALNTVLGPERVARLQERGAIELAPLAYMRGRTLTESFVILDEAQNTSIEQMRMFLTRIGFGSTVVVTGDITQTDLPRGQVPGLAHAAAVLRDIPEIAFHYFEAEDVVRHPLIRKIVEAYERGRREEREP